MLEGMKDRKTKRLESNKEIFVHEWISLFFPLTRLTLQSFHGTEAFQKFLD